ncbi:nucleotidyltransferase [Candidatus Francisella endociliophora]|uniref:Nucleotidyltransferase n=1 Tax=Candidatus Francisella endociliophora TaxID=653937 RepID=A0A097ELV7_9GAMM|nr:ATP-binding protein [Francisella sp. FSC1006]AIT08552.1 nucleotidyltransferase [Francisella sp. FSC1006]
MSIKIGEVIAIKGVSVSFKVYEESNKEVLFHNGEELRGLSIREYILIYRGFKKIVCMVEGEYLDESRVENEGNKTTYIRKVDAKPVGYFDVDGTFVKGIKYLPMIKDSVYLASDTQIKNIFSINSDENFKIGNLLKEEIPISLPWYKLFNTHIGVFGNTGSGKSNTLTKLYTELFDKKIDFIKDKSNFLIIDFNGEYTNDQFVDSNNKNVINLNTRVKDSGEKLTVNDKDIWNTEILSLLFQATRSTQTPFINRVVSGKEKYATNNDSLKNYIKTTIKKAFTTSSQHKDTKELIIQVLETLECSEEDVISKFRAILWHGNQDKFYIKPSTYFDGGEECPTYSEKINDKVESITCDKVDFFKELQIRINLQLINDLIHGYVQFDHIQPLLKRIESSINSLEKVLNVISNDDTSENENKLLSVISFRNCNQEIKKILPLIIAKQYYEAHKKNNPNSPPDTTFHLIIDEAHNILSEQSSREHEIWKDYRLEVFEEIIKEGRKYGFFLTISSQRPADISATIMSQIHNFFIHRLVNDRDLFLLDNTISTLDNLSKKMIHNLSKGSCVVTGVSFDIPLLLQVEKLNIEKQPDSQDIDLNKLWSKNDQ